MFTSAHVCRALLFAMPDAGKLSGFLLLVSCPFICQVAPTARRGFPASSPSWVQVADNVGAHWCHTGRSTALAGARQAGTLEPGAGRLSRGHSLARLPSRGCL